jgi:hypothetical protein
MPDACFYRGKLKLQWSITHAFVAMQWSLCSQLGSTTNLLCLIQMIAEEIGAKSGSIPCFHNCRGIEKSYR